MEKASILLPLFQPNLNATFQNWHGGRVYIENFARVLSDPSVAERVAIHVLTDGPVDLPIVRTRRGPGVDGEFRYLEPGVQGDRVSGARKPATLETGLVIQVPLFVNPGDRVKVENSSFSAVGVVVSIVLPMTLTENWSASSTVMSSL